MKLSFILSAILLTEFAAFGEPPLTFVSLEKQMIERSRSIIIPHVEFQDVPVAEVLECLRDGSKEHDPNHVGIGIDADWTPVPMITSKTAPPPPGGWDLDDLLKRRITLSVRDASVAEIVHQVAKLSYRHMLTRSSGLFLVPTSSCSDILETHTISLSGGSKSLLKKMRADPREFFIANGVQFCGGTTCVFKKDGKTLVVQNTIDQIDTMYLVLKELGSSKAQPR